MGFLATYILSFSFSLVTIFFIIIIIIVAKKINLKLETILRTFLILVVSVDLCLIKGAFDWPHSRIRIYFGLFQPFRPYVNKTIIPFLE